MCNLERLPFSPTHHVGAQHSTIDYICVSDTAHVLSYKQEYWPSISEHDVLFAEFSFLVPGVSSGTIFRRSFRHFDAERFHRDLASIDWHRVVSLTSLDEKVHAFTSALIDLYDVHAPYRSFTPKRKSSPWFSANLRTLIRARNKAWRAFKRYGRPRDHIEYKRLRNNVKTATRNAISMYYQRKFSSATNSAAMWRCVDELGLSSNSKATFSLPTDVNTLNRHFAGFKNSAPLVDQRPTARIPPDMRFYFQYVNASDVVEAILSAHSNARGPDDIPASYLKECLLDILPILLHIFDCSLQSGVFPSVWKRAIVRPLPKRSPPLEIDHLRPISILCATSKILEFLAFKQITDFVSRHDLLNPYQSGFRKKYSTHTALITIADDFREAIDKEKVVLSVAIDFKQAFDLVNICLLVDKLKALGFSDAACSWVYSYLAGRSQVVVAAAGESSSPVFRTSGVPQGSPIGPLFFSLFINDAPSVLRFCKYHLYADDLTLYYSGSFNNVQDILAKVNSDLELLATWATNNGMSINAKKSQAIWIGSRGFISRLRALNLQGPSIAGQEIEYREEIKILGIMFDSTLSWSQQTTQTSRKCYAALSRLRKCDNLIPRSTKLLLAKALIFPYLDYCAGLFLDLSSELTLKLRRCKNAALRFATGTSRFDHISPVYAANNIMQYSARRDFLCICLLACILRSSEPRILYERLAFRQLDRIGSKRCSEYDLIVPWARTECFKSSFAIEGPRLWNSLPIALRALYVRPNFKAELAHYLLQESSKPAGWYSRL